MNKKVIIYLLMAGVFLFASANRSFAQGIDLPAADDPFWTITDQLHDPIDSSCYSKAVAIYLAAGSYGDGTAAATGACASLTAMLSMESVLQTSGIETNLFDNETITEGDLLDNDWRSINGLYFEAPGLGRIEFTQPIDFMSHDFLTFLSEFSTRAQMNQGEIGLDADIVGGLAGYGAVLTMYNAGDFNDPEILVNGREDSEGIVSGLDYDPTTHNIIFNAAHFTTFTATEKSVTEKPKIAKVGWEKYTSASGVAMVKITLKGKHFKKSTDVTLGGKSATKVRYKTSKKIVATFKLAKITESGKQELKLKAFNGTKVGQYRKKISLADLL